jgi:hypothetical protein
MKNYTEPIGQVIKSPNIESITDGLNKLEHFSGIALQGIISNMGMMEDITKAIDIISPDANDPIKYTESVARIAILYAKGLLNELGKEPSDV